MPVTAGPQTRAEIATEIAIKKTKYDRMPKHWEARRIEVMREIDWLVDRWLEADG